MTNTTIPLYSMTMKAGESLVGDLERALAEIQASQIKTKTRFQDWKTVAKAPRDPQSTQLIDAGMMGFFLDFLFGMPMFSGVSDAAQGMMQVGLMAHQDMGRANAKPSSISFEDLLSSQRRVMNGALSDQKSQAAQMKKMRQMAMLMLWMMMNQDDSDGSQGESEGHEMIATDVLRHPKLARFKQNRHSLSCIREMFQNQAVSVAPRFDTLRCAA